MRYTWFVIFMLASLTVFGQKSSRVRQLEEQRKKALAEIETASQLLKETNLTARNSLSRLNLLSQQILSRKKVINLLSQEVSEIDNQIAVTRQEIAGLEKELDSKRSNYGKSAQSLFRHRGSQDKLLFILSASDFAQSMRRMRYLREYADWQKRQASEIIDKQTEIKQKQKELEKTRSEKNALLDTREKESQKLQTEENNQKAEVKQLGKKQKELKEMLRKKQQQANALNRQIEEQIAKEIARAEAEAKQGGTNAKGKNTDKTSTRQERIADTKGGYAMTKEERKLSNDFADNRGRLPYPVAGRYTIVGTFGEQQHQELKYVRTNNSGIDIQTTPGADARAVFKGEVTRVFVVPGYNNSVIIRHGNYLTVYSNLSQVYVKAGDKVNTCQTIGKIFSDAENGNATILHFQLWKEKTKLNPSLWLN